MRRLQSLVPFKLLLLCGVPLMSCLLPVHAQQDDVVEMAGGPQPGPPLWKVSKGAHELWILPLGILPEGMIWENDEVTAIIATADEAIGPPDISLGVSPALLLNPVNLVRGVQLYNRLRRNPSGALLADVLPEGIRQRYAALKVRYFPDNDAIDALRPALAAEAMAKEVLAQERLSGPGIMTRKVDELIRGDRDIRVTDVKVERMLEGSYDELRERLENALESVSLASEIDCFESQLTLFERHLNDMKRVANAWATGNAREIEDLVQPGDMQTDCSALVVASSEGDLAQGLLGESRQRWFDAVVTALERNRSTFAMLPIAYITGSSSLVDRLADLGYRVEAPL